MDWLSILIIVGVIFGSLVACIMVVVAIFWVWLLWQIRKSNREIDEARQRIMRGRCGG